MNFLNSRTGFFIRSDKINGENTKIYHFYIDNEKNLYYISNSARIEKAIKLSKSINEISTRLEKLNTKKLLLKLFKLGNIKPF